MARTRSPLNHRGMVKDAEPNTSLDGSPCREAVRNFVYSEVDDLLGRCLGSVEIIGVGTRREVLPPTVADDEHNDAVIDR